MHGISSHRAVWLAEVTPQLSSSRQWAGPAASGRELVFAHFESGWAPQQLGRQVVELIGGCKFCRWRERKCVVPLMWRGATPVQAVLEQVVD
ncbi:hypothetical protein PoB_003837500 [Plakobranchus ocellatus]|uniref:Uncharacterized protein n=1 Tax=Plakobranchus ocellatus TaxID=259542 RepID=A0AAV4AX93_9GAST|nr:hypothetical protein PoB_003837500 [Plakobranchus ocellatus]